MSSSILTILLLFLIMILINLWFIKQGDERELREIPAINKIQSSLENSIEDGSRIHFAIGRSEVTSPEIISGIIALNLLKHVTYISANSDLPPISSAGTGSLMLLSQDTIQKIYKNIGLQSSYSHNLGRFVGPTPFTFASGAAINIAEKNISTNLMLGNFGIEVGLLTHNGEQSETITIAGTDNILGQATIYATAHEHLIGEEVFAANAYIRGKDIHRASLFAQDNIRILIILGISAASIYGLIKGFL